MPGTAISLLVGLLVSRRLGRSLGSRPAVAVAVVVGFGMIVSATLTPLYGETNLGAVGGTCDFSRVGFAPVQELLRFDDTSLNVLLFIPLGIAIGLIGEGRPRAGLFAAGIALPFAIETIQLLVPALGRGCQSADVIDNLTGLALGIILGTGARLAWEASARDVPGAGPAPD